MDPQSKVWTEIEISGTWPEGRSQFSWSATGDLAPSWTGTDQSTVYLFGGYGDISRRGTQNELWEFSTTASTWAQLASWPGPSDPEGLCFGASGGLIYLLGDWADIAGYFWSYDPEDRAWTERTDSVTVEGSNPWTRSGGALLDVAGELLLVHGKTTGIATMLPSLMYEC